MKSMLNGRNVLLILTTLCVCFYTNRISLVTLICSLGLLCLRSWKSESVRSGFLWKVIELLVHPIELLAVLKYFVFRLKPKLPVNLGADEKFCYTSMCKVSRSFATVTLELGTELRLPVTVFYLVLRGLDSIEDDMSVPLEKKLPEMKAFPSKLNVRGWNSQSDFGAGLIVAGRESAKPDPEVELLRNFQQVIACWHGLKKPYAEIIQEKCAYMSEGMQHYLQNEIKTLKDFDQYCFYVAGVVGLGLVRMFAESQLEDSEVEENEEIAVNMGVFLQKTNILRDYWEDTRQTEMRIFWPRDVWGKYVTEFNQFLDSANILKARMCLNELIFFTLGEIPGVLKFLSKLSNPSIFKFCAIPQIMAIATLERCFDNPRVFNSVVKIRKGEALHLMINKSNSFSDIVSVFQTYTNSILGKVPAAVCSPFRSQLTHKLEELDRLYTSYTTLSKGRILLGKRADRFLT